MKKNVFVLIMLSFLMLLTNCSQDDCVINPDLSELKSDDDSVITVSTEEELNAFISTLYPFKHENLTEPIVETRAGLIPKKYYGYHSMQYYKKNLKMYFNGDAAVRVGVPAGIYICHTRLVFALFTINNGSFVTGDSPNCGLSPSVGSELGYMNFNSRGYMISSNHESCIDLRTILLHLEYDMAGRNVNVYFPRRPENLIWDYAIRQ